MLSKILAGSVRVLALAVLWGAFIYGASYVLPAAGFNIAGGIKLSETDVISGQIQIMKQVTQPDISIRKPVM